MKRMPIVSLFATLVLFSFHPAEAQKPPAHCAAGRKHDGHELALL